MGDTIPGLVVLGSISKQPECLRVSIAVKRHHYHSNSYKGKHLIWYWFSSLSSCWEAWSYIGRYGARKGAENSKYGSACNSQELSAARPGLNF